MHGKGYKKEKNHILIPKASECQICLDIKNAILHAPPYTNNKGDKTERMKKE